MHTHQGFWWQRRWRVVYHCFLLFLAFYLNISVFTFPLRSVILDSLCRCAHCPSAPLCKCVGHKLELAAAATLFELSLWPSVQRCAVIARTQIWKHIVIRTYKYYICMHVFVSMEIKCLLIFLAPLVLVYLNGEISPVCLRLIMPCGI